MSELKNNNFYVVLAFMVKDLKLKGLEREVYAIIYGLCQNKGKFNGSLQYLADWTCCSKQSVINALNKLIEKNLIVKNDVYFNGVKFVEYYTTDYTTIQESLMGSQESIGGIQESLPNNIEYNIEYNIKENNISKDIFKENSMKTNEKRKYGDNQKVILTDDEYSNLVKDYGKDYVDAMIVKLDEYVAMNNNKNGYKNFNLVMRKALKEQWFKLNPNNFIKPVNTNLDLDSKADTINDKTPSIEVRAKEYFTNLYHTDMNKYYIELENLKQKNPSLAKYVISQVENGGFEEL